jgi:hypothetical protein
MCMPTGLKELAEDFGKTDLISPGTVFSCLPAFLIHFAFQMSKYPLLARHLIEDGKWFPPS